VRKPFFMLIILLLFVVSIAVIPALWAYSPTEFPRSLHSKIQSGAVYLQVYNTSRKKTEYVNIEEYLPGVIAAEMPASYEPEALKAQAVAARSYIFYKLDIVSPEHPDAAVCDNPNHCKAHITEAEARKKWAGTEADRYWKKIVDAVSSTKGEYMVCDDEVVEAFFFAQSGGRTENSEDVWGESRPYLKSVESPENLTSADFTSAKEVTFREFRKILSTQNPKIAVNSSAPVIGETVRTQGQSVKSLTVDNIPFSGKEIRTLFELKSANFTISLSENSVVFSVIGYGHGVGMSQSGANEMAKNGKKYTEILSHYYTNIQIMKI